MSIRSSEWSRRTERPVLGLALVCALTFVVYLDSSITPVALPAIRADIGAGVTAAQWLLDAYTLAFAVLLLSAGSFGDRVGRSAVLIGGGLGFTAASVACALAPDTGVLLAARAAQGVFAAAVVPLSLAAVSTAFPDPTARGRAIGVWGGVAGCSVALGPLVGGVLVDDAGWRGVFWLNVPVGLVATAGLAGLAWQRARFAPRSGRTSGAAGPPSRVDVVGQALFIAGTGALTFAAIEGTSFGWSSPTIVGLLVAGAAALVAFVRWERRVDAPMLPPDLVRIPAVAVACLVNLLGFVGLYGVLFLLTLYLQGTVHLSPTQTGLRFVALTGFLGLMSVAGLPVARRLGTKATMVLGLVLCAVGLSGVTLVQHGGFPLYAWALALIGAGIPLSGGVVAIQAMMGRVPPAQAATASATMNTFRQIGAVYGVALAGILSPVREGRVTSMDVTFSVSAVGALVAAALTLVVLRPGVADSEPAADPARTRSPVGDRVP
ncbi:MAG: MFS transporter [Frankia sp.]